MLRAQLFFTCRRAHELHGLELDLSKLSQAAFIKAAHRGFADGADFEQGAGRCVDGFKCIGFEFGLGCGFSGHGISLESSSLCVC